MKIGVQACRDRLAPVKKFACLSLLAILLTLGLYRLTPFSPGIHYLQYRAAANLLMSGRNPYDLEQQTLLQRSLQEGGNRPFIQYSYPPWFAIACAPLSVLPYLVAEVFFLFLISFCLVLSGWLLHSATGGLSLWATILIVVGFLPSLIATQTSQTAPLVLLLMAITWRSLDHRQDWLAGAALAALSIKPQLTLAIVVGVLLWAARCRRWEAIQAFAVTLGLFCLASSTLFPSWPLAMVEAWSQIPLARDGRPPIGVTWPSVVRSLGLVNWPFAVAYASLAVPAAALVVFRSWRRDSRPVDVIGGGAIAAFAIAPYAQFYDLPVLLLPLLALLANRQPSPAMFALLLGFLVLPYLNFWALIVSRWPTCTFAWAPATLAIAWLLRA
jgi:hypothetical protein